MAEALAAVGAAASILQLISFCTNIGYEAAALAHSSNGVLREHIGNTQLAEEYKSLCNSIQTTEATATTAVERLSHKCKVQAGQLLELLQSFNIEAEHSGVKAVWHSGKQATRAAWKRQEIESQRARLQLLNGQLQTALALEMRQRNGEHFQEQNEKVAEILDAIRGGQRQVINAIISSHEVVPESTHDENPKSAQDDVPAISNATATATDDVDVDASSKKWFESEDVTTRLHKLQTFGKPKDESPEYLFSEMVMAQLGFGEMNERHGSIVEAYPNTLSWALRVDFSGLSTWLSSPGGIYWVAGKAGSGKSTLLKFLADQKQTRKLLRHGTGTKDVRILDTYFWYLGTDLQRSIHGLWRTLLYQLLKHAKYDAHGYQRPLTLYALQKILFRERYDAVVKRGQAVADQPPFTVAEIQKAISRIPWPGSTRTSHSDVLKGMGFCIIIDGLDEFVGDQLELIAQLNDIASTTQVKICVSSRPWNVFLRAYKLHHPHLFLEDLTRNDIETYTRGCLTQTCARVGRECRDGSMEALIAEITNGAEGVFLWVYLVVLSVERGLAENDPISVLKRRVASFPKDLELFFETILDRVDDVYKCVTPQMLKLACLLVEHPEQRQPSFFLDYWFLLTRENGLQSMEDVDELETRSYSHGDLSDMAKWTQERTSATCKDLLCISQTALDAFIAQKSGFGLPKVDFLHRTVYEFISSDRQRQVMDSKVPSCFKDGSAMLYISRARMKLTIDDSFIDENEFELAKRQCHLASLIASQGIAEDSQLAKFMKLHFGQSAVEEEDEGKLKQKEEVEGASTAGNVAISPVPKTVTPCAEKKRHRLFRLPWQTNPIIPVYASCVHLQSAFQDVIRRSRERPKEDILEIGP